MLRAGGTQLEKRVRGLLARHDIGWKRVRPVGAWPIPAKEITGLPEIEHKESTNDRRTCRRTRLQRTHDKGNEPDSGSRKNQNAQPIDQRIAPTLELRRAVRPRDAPMQFPDE